MTAHNDHGGYCPDVRVHGMCFSALHSWDFRNYLPLLCIAARTYFMSLAYNIVAVSILEWIGAWGFL